MAYTQEGGMSFSLQDSAGVRTSLHMPILIDPTQTVAAAAAAWNVQAGLLDAVTGAKILKGVVEVLVQGAGMTFTPKSPSPINPSDIEKTGNIDFPAVVSGKVYDSIIPAVQNAILSAGGGRINEAAAAFIAYLAPLETPPTFAEFVNAAFQVWSAHVDTFVSFRKHRRRLHELSLETP